MSYTTTLVLLALGFAFSGVFGTMFAVQTKSRLMSPRSAWGSGIVTSLLLAAFIITALMLLDLFGVKFA